MHAYVSGDAGAFEALFARLAPRVHAFFVRSFRDAVLADDLLQTTFMNFHRARIDFRRGSQVRAWLFAIASRVRLDTLRRRSRLREDVGGEAAEPIAPDSASPEAAADGADVALAVRAAVDALPEP